MINNITKIAILIYIIIIGYLYMSKSFIFENKCHMPFYIMIISTIIFIFTVVLNKKIKL